jgi:hypothetical protein
MKKEITFTIVSICSVVAMIWLAEWLLGHPESFLEFADRWCFVVLGGAAGLVGWRAFRVKKKPAVGEKSAEAGKQ